MQVFSEIINAVETPEVGKESKTKEALDRPWKVVVHNDPVNLMSYVTMTFQKVFGYPSEKAEMHMLEVHRSGTFDFVERSAGTGGVVRPATAWLPPSRDDRTDELRMEVFRKNGSLEISEIDPFLAELLRQIPASTKSEAVPAVEQRLFSAPAGPNEKELCAEWKIYVEPELRRLFQTTTETVAADLQQLGENEKPFANSALRIPMRTPTPG